MSNKAKKILVVGPSWVGDMIMTQSLFKLIKQRNQQTIIDVLAPNWSRPLLERMPEVNGSIVLPFKHGELKLKERYRLACELREQNYDQAMLIPNSFKSALIPFWAKIPRRTGWSREFRWGFVNDVRYLDELAMPKVVQRFAALALDKGEALAEDFPLPAMLTEQSSISQALQQHNLTRPQKPILALCPGSEFGSAKRWPADYYAKLAEQKAKEGWGIWVFGSPKDRPIADEIKQHCQWPCIDLVGKTSLGEVIDLLSLATVVVSNDSGLMHLSSALNKPTIAIYGSTPPEFAPPLTKQSKILFQNLDCSPCRQRECPLGHHRCMRDLSVEQVNTSITNLVTT